MEQFLQLFLTLVVTSIVVLVFIVLPDRRRKARGKALREKMLYEYDLDNQVLVNQVNQISDAAEAFKLPTRSKAYNIHFSFIASSMSLLLYFFGAVIIIGSIYIVGPILPEFVQNIFPTLIGCIVTIVILDLRGNRRNSAVEKNKAVELKRLIEEHPSSKVIADAEFVIIDSNKVQVITSKESIFGNENTVTQ